MTRTTLSKETVMACHPDHATSVDRRQFVALGLAATAAGAWAAPRAGTAAADQGTAPTPGEDLVLSGRLCGSQGQALAGVRIEFGAPGENTQVVWADGDGRFLLQGSTPSAALTWRASANGRPLGGGHLDLAAPHLSGRGDAHVQRDTQGVWRASAGLTLA